MKKREGIFDAAGERSEDDDDVEILEGSKAGGNRGGEGGVSISLCMPL